jgi:hypothetical protein
MGALWCKGHQNVVMLCVRPLESTGTLITRQGSALLQQLIKVPRNPKIQENSVNQGDHNDIKRQSNHSKNTKFNMDKIK